MWSLGDCKSLDFATDKYSLSAFFELFEINFRASSISNLQSASSVVKYQQFAKSLISTSVVLFNVKL